MKRQDWNGVEMSATIRKHGGPRPGAGRPPRTEPKTQPIWVGQITAEQRRLILTLTPEERFAALVEAAREKAANSGGK